jgi:hypothetical protein
MPHQVPINQRLWAMVITQAKTRFATYPSPAASHWVHSEYQKKGGQFKEVSDETRRQEVLARQFLRKRHERLAAKAKEEKSEHKSDKKKDKK